MRGLCLELIGSFGIAMIKRGAWVAIHVFPA